MSLSRFEARSFRKNRKSDLHIVLSQSKLRSLWEEAEQRYQDLSNRSILLQVRHEDQKQLDDYVPRFCFFSPGQNALRGAS